MVHQTAGLAEIFIFGVLCNFRDGNRVYRAVVVKIVEHGAHEYLIRRRGRKPRPRQYARSGCRIKTADFVAVIEKALAHPAHKGGGMSGFVFLHGQIRKVYDIHRIACAFYTDNILGIYCRRRDSVQINPCRQHLAVVVVGVVAADFGSAGGGKQADIPLTVIQTGKFVCQSGIAVILCADGFVRNIYTAQTFVIRTCIQGFFQCSACRHRETSFQLFSSGVSLFLKLLL